MAERKKPSKSYYKRKADGLFSRWIRRRDGACLANESRPESCESPLFLQCAHIHTRSYSATRYDPDNAITLCRSCHLYFTHRPLEWREFIDQLKGLSYYDQIGRRALAGARALVGVDYEAEAARFENAE